MPVPRRCSSFCQSLIPRFPTHIPCPQATSLQCVRAFFGVWTLWGACLCRPTWLTSMLLCWFPCDIIPVFWFSVQCGRVLYCSHWPCQLASGRGKEHTMVVVVGRGVVHGPNFTNMSWWNVFSLEDDFFDPSSIVITVCQRGE